MRPDLWVAHLDLGGHDSVRTHRSSRLEVDEEFRLGQPRLVLGNTALGRRSEESNSESSLDPLAQTNSSGGCVRQDLFDRREQGLGTANQSMGRATGVDVTGGHGDRRNQAADHVTDEMELEIP